jgi:hypothetical protein
VNYTAGGTGGREGESAGVKAHHLGAEFDLVVGRVEQPFDLTAGKIFFAAFFLP